MSKIKLIAVVGATASGKTALAVELALALGGEIVSCDSMQLYRGMRVATAVPTEEERRGVPHHMMEILDPDESFSVAEYCKRANDCITDIHSRGKIPILCGGTGLYYSSLADGVEFADIGGSAEVRERVGAEYDAHGGEYMLAKMAAFDPEAAARIKPADRKRIVRAFEVYECTGMSISGHNSLSKQGGSPYDMLALGIDYVNRENLYERINKRVDIMLISGIIEEAREFYRAYPEPGTAAQAIGYKELRPWLCGELDRDTAVESLKRQTRRYAKRQLSWFRRDERIEWLYAENFAEREQLTAEAVSRARYFING